MKKKLNNKKGFSLVELLIVLAILAIIASISISVFANVLENQRIKADKGAAAYLQSAIQTYLTESDDINLSSISNSNLAEIVGSLKNTVTIDDNNYGPYIKSDYVLDTKSKKYTGFEVKIDMAAQSIEVKCSTSGDSFSTN